MIKHAKKNILVEKISVTSKALILNTQNQIIEMIN